MGQRYSHPLIMVMSTVVDTGRREVDGAVLPVGCLHLFHLTCNFSLRKCAKTARLLSKSSCI